MPQIEVTFDIDANGIVNVSAKDKATGKEQKIAITGSSGLAKNEVEKLVRDAEAHAAEDKSKRELIDARNQAESLAWSVEKTLNESRTKVPVSTVSAIDAAIAVVREAVKGDDVAVITRATEDLQAASHAMAQTLYQGAEGAQGAQGAEGARGTQGAPNRPAEGEVVDAEFAETK